MEREKPYPTRDGIPVSTVEIWQDLVPEASRYTQEFNNHHLAFTQRMFGRFALFSTFRNLSSMQEQIPLDQHNALHRIFDPPMMPTPEQAMDYVVEAYETKQPLRHGSAYRPIFSLIQADKMRTITQEYNSLR